MLPRARPAFREAVYRLRYACYRRKKPIPGRDDRESLWAGVDFGTSATIASMFHVRCIFPHQGRIESTSFELHPANPRGEAVCVLFQRFLEGHPPAFRERLPFLRRGDIELDWSAAEGGVALASLFCSDQPAAISVLLTGQNSEADSMMIDVFRENVLDLLFAGQFQEALAAPERPLLIQVLFPGDPEWTPAIQLLSAALASVYFRSILDPPCR